MGVKALASLALPVQMVLPAWGFSGWHRQPHEFFSHYLFGFPIRRKEICNF
jgi:hypothetical protein